MEYVHPGRLLDYLRSNRSSKSYYNHLSSPSTTRSRTPYLSAPSNSTGSSNGHGSRGRVTPSAPSSPLTAKILLQYAIDIVKGKEFISSHGIIHRDLAARNILLSGHTCKVADFGLAKSVRDTGDDCYESKTRGALPLRWMAPESLFLGIFSIKSDVWSYGILLWEILTLGATPYPGRCAKEVLEEVKLGRTMDRPDHCSSELFELLKDCWSPGPDQRPTFGLLREHLSKLLAAESGYIDLDRFQETNYFYYNASPQSGFMAEKL